MLGKIRSRPLGITTSVLLPLALAVACSGADSAPTGPEPVSESAEAIGVAIANGCMVFWDKINYDTPVNNDAGELIELRVVKNAGSTATTLGQCGLAALVLLNGDNCQPYATINLNAVQIPNDGFVQICDTAWSSACDVDRPQNWLQNDNEALVFVGPGLTPLLHASWENVGNTKICLPADAGTLPSIVVPTENNTAPDQISVWCSGGFQVRPAATAGLGMAYTCGADAGTDAATDAASDGAGGTGGAGDAAVGGSGGTAVGGSGGTATGGSGGTATGGSGGTAVGGSGGTAVGGSGGTATGGSGGTATGGSGGTATGGSGGTATGGSGGTATGGSAGAATGGTGGGATGGAAGAATGGSAGAATGGAAGAATGGSAGAATGGAGGTGGSGTGGSGTGGSGTGGKADAGPGSGSDSDDDGGCGCRVPGGSSAPSGNLLALLGAALFFARRRR
ncbi:MAG: MYXO-CTERM sorting domain-containing protein [Myxococcales bacterium]|nr:MYXO-CTERM sorting domain-containing protein [Myxococcales bacterium]